MYIFLFNECQLISYEDNITTFDGTSVEFKALI